MTKKLLVTTFVVGFGSLVAARDASAIQILGFGQTSGTNTLTLNNNGAGLATSSTITGTTTVGITNIDGVNPGNSTFTVTATSTSLATQAGAFPFLVDQQHFSGTFSIINGVTNVLSGTFVDVVFGFDALHGLVLTSGTPPAGNLTFTSDIIPNTDLGLDRAFSLSFSNLTPGLTIFNNSLGASGATSMSFTGTASANLGVTEVPEPTSMLLLGTGLLGAAASARRRRRAKV